MVQKQALQLFNDRQIRTVWDEKEKKWYFSIVDVVAALTDSTNAQTYWRVLKKRLIDEGDETVTNCNAFKMPAADGKMRLTDVATTELSQKHNPSNFEQNKRVAKGGGHVAKIARNELEKQLGRSAITSANAKGLKAPDDAEQIEDSGTDTDK